MKLPLVAVGCSTGRGTSWTGYLHRRGACCELEDTVALETQPQRPEPKAVRQETPLRGPAMARSGQEHPCPAPDPGRGLGQFTTPGQPHRIQKMVTTHPASSIVNQTKDAGRDSSACGSPDGPALKSKVYQLRILACPVDLCVLEKDLVHPYKFLSPQLSIKSRSPSDLAEFLPRRRSHMPSRFKDGSRSE